MYYQNGAEYGNLLVGNVFGCQHKLNAVHGWISSRCSLADGVPTQVDSDFNEQSAIYLLQPNAADVIGNHAFGFDNAHFINQQGGIFGFGGAGAEGTVPLKAMPIAINANNVILIPTLTLPLPLIRTLT